MAIAFFNYGVELEHLNDFQSSLQAYEKALGFTKEFGIQALEGFIQEAVQKVRERINGIDGSLTRRSMMREENSTIKKFKDDKHIKEIDRKTQSRKLMDETRARLMLAQARKVHTRIMGNWASDAN